MNAVGTAVVVGDVKSLQPEAVSEKKARRRSLRLRRLAHSPDKSNDTAPSSLPMTPLAQHSEKGILSPRMLPIGEGSRTSPPIGEAKLPMAISWPNLSTASGRLMLSPRPKEVSPRDLNRQMLASSAEKALSLSKTIAVDDDNDDGDHQTAPLLIPKRHSVDLTPRARAALSRSQLMPLYEKSTVSEILDKNRIGTDSMRRVSSSSTTTTTSSGDNSSNSTSTEKKNVFSLDSDADESSRTSVEDGTASSPAVTENERLERNKTLPRRKSELYFQEFVATAPVGSTVSPLNSPRSRSGTLLENNGPLIRVNSYSYSSDHGSPRGTRSETPRELLARRLKRDKTISKGATVIYFYYEPFEARKMLFVVPNSSITAAMRLVIKRAVKSTAEGLLRGVPCSATCAKVDGICREHLDPDAVAKFPLIAVLDRKCLIDDYRYPHLLDMFHKAHPTMLLNDWTQYKKDAACEEFLDVRITHIYHVRTYV